MKRVVVSAVAVFFILLATASAASAANDGTPRIANYFLKWHLSDAEVEQLSRWDVVILDPETQFNTRPQLERLRRKFPRPLMLAYITSQEIRKNAAELTEAPLRRKLAAAIPDSWYLTDTKNNRTSWWPGASLLNVTDRAPTAVGGERWNTFFPRFLAEQVLFSGLWDGVFLDNAWGYISWIPFSKDFDLNRDGVAESREALDSTWKQGMEKIVSEIRRRSPGMLVYGNSIKFGPNLTGVLDGAMIENFPDPGWQQFMESYQRHQPSGRPGFVTILNGSTGNRGTMDDYQRFRYTLGSTLLGNGQVSYDFGDQAHEQLWYYDEYDARIGAAEGSARNLLEFRQGGKFIPGLWQRDFGNAVVVLNSTRLAQTARFRDPLDRLFGRQDPSVNSGQSVTDVTLAAGDGVVLSKPLLELTGVVFRVGSFVRVLDSRGTSKRRGFFPTASAAQGGTLQWVGELDGDGNADTINADATALTIQYSSGARRVLSPYGARYRGGISFAVGDLNGDGRPEVVTGAASGGAQLQIFDRSGRRVGGFVAFPDKNASGVRVAVGDVNGDGRAEILATRAKFPSLVRVYTASGKLVRRFSGPSVPASAGGYTLAAGDLNRDGRAEALIGTGVGSAPQLGVYTGQGNLLRQFAPLAQENRAGFLLGVTDVDGDGVNEILVMAERVR